MKILFVYAGSIDPRSIDIDVNKSIFHKLMLKIVDYPTPLTFPLLAALTPRHHKVELMEGRLNDIKFDNGYDLVGISCTTRFALWAYEIADEFRNRGIKVALGGWHPSALPHEAKQHADSVVIGEAEETWSQLLKDIENGKLKSFYQPTRPADPKLIPQPRYDLYPRGKKFGIMATRGCPYGCEFCAITNMRLRNVFRMRPIENVIEEIKSHRDRYLYFHDNSLTINVEYTKQLFKAMKGLNKRFYANGNIGALGKDNELLKLSVEAGCLHWFIGFESICQDSLDSVSKKNRVSEYLSSIKKIHDYGIVISGAFIFGFDYDTPDIFDKTDEFVRISEIDCVDSAILTPFPGTPLFDRLDRERRILTKDWSKYDFQEVVYQPKNMTKEELLTNIRRLNRKWYKTTSCLRRILKSIKFGWGSTLEMAFENFYLKAFNEY